MKYYLFFCSIMISSCSTYYPLPIDETNIEKRIDNDVEHGLPVAINQDDAVKNMKSYSDWYLIKAMELKKSQYKFSDASLGFTLAGLVAGFSGEAETAAGSSLMANFFGWPQSRYKIEVQASNYAKASDAMACMHRYMIPLLKDSPLNKEAMPTIDFFNEKIDEVRKKLRKLQLDVVLADPDLSKINEAIKVILSGGDRTLSFFEKTDEDKRKEIEANLNKCVANFSI